MKPMKLLISQRAALILTEATITTLVGMMHNIAGITLTYALAIAHIYLDRQHRTKKH